MASPKLIAVSIAVLALVWVGSGVIFGTSDPGAAPAEEPSAGQPALVDVRVRDIAAQDFADDVIVTGRTQASRRVELKVETGGQVMTMLKEEGDRVAKDDVLAELEIRDRDARVREARERVQQRQIEYNAAKKLEDRGFNSKVRLSQALADLEDAKAALKQAEIEQEKTRIIAPFEGIIFEQHAEIGDYLSVGDPVLSLVDLDPIEFVGYVTERRVQDLKPGIEVRAELLNGEFLTGTISYIAPAADPQTRTFRIIVSAPNGMLLVKEGLTAKLRIPVAMKKAHKISPAILSLDDAGRIGVKIVNEANVVEFVPVQILADEPTAMYIAGPPENARIITVGQEFVRAGQEVNPVAGEGDGTL